MDGGTGGGAPRFTSTNISNTIDYNGDGIPDYQILKAQNGRNISGTIRMGQGSIADLVTSITDGLGSTTTITYKAAKDSSIYTPGAAVAYPIRELRASTPVVAEVYKDSGVDGTPAHFSYQYSGNRLDLSGRGALGFHSFVTLDRQTNIFKYQFLAQSFPMTGLTAREQTYRYWESSDGGSVFFRRISSHDNTVVFDEVVNASGATLGTVYPFISQAVESRWENSDTPHHGWAKPQVAKAAGAPASLPEALFPTPNTTDAHITISATSLFDNQAAAQTTIPGGYTPGDRKFRTGADAAWSDNVVTGSTNYTAFHALAFPRKITYGNLCKLSTDYGDGFTETVSTSYKAPVTASNGATLTGLIDRVATTVTSPTGGTEYAPTKTYTYWGNNTPLVASETTTAYLPGTATATADTKLTSTTTYDRDSRGRVTATRFTGYRAPGPEGDVVVGSLSAANCQHVGSFTISRVTKFDDRFDLPATTLDTYGHTTTTTYDTVYGLPKTVRDPNGAGVNIDYDALGRRIKETDALTGITTTTTYAWNTSLTVAPPSGWTGAAAGCGISGVSGVSLPSRYSVQVATTAKPTITTYHDRLGRPIRTVKSGYADQIIYTDTAYNNLGQTIATSLPYKKGTTVYWNKTEYDALGRVKTVIAPNGTRTAHTYNGRCTTVTVDAPNLGGADPAAQTNTTYVDAKGRTIKVWNADNPAASLNPKTGSATTASIEYKLDGFGRMRQTILKDQSQIIKATYDGLGRQLTLDDPDKGLWTYVNNALGQVVRQTDAVGNVTATYFDRLGRPLTRKTTEPNSGPVETAGWFYYDSKPDGRRHAVSKGTKGWDLAPAYEESITTGLSSGYPQTKTSNAHYYDAKGRPEINLNIIDGKYFYTYAAYDSYSRPSTLRYHWRQPGADAPTTLAGWQDFGYSYTYDAKSYLTKMTDLSYTAAFSGRTWWTVGSLGYDHMDRPLQVSKGGATSTTRTYRPTDGVLTAIATSAGTKNIQNLAFNYDGLGNLTSRASIGGTETCTYDNLNRLKSSKQGTYTYAANGNILTKAGVSGTYTYSNTKPHAVASAAGFTMGYDANGNMVTRTGGGTSWTIRMAGFDKPRWMTKTTGTTVAGNEFHYNAARSRILHLDYDAVSNGAPQHYTLKRVYAFGANMEVDYKNTTTSGAGRTWALSKIRVYIPGPDGVIGAREYAGTGTADSAKIYHYDHLGSIESVTNLGDNTGALARDYASPTKEARFSYDAWGQRRNPTTLSGAPTATDNGGADGVTPHGYTSHEMLDDTGLVHMNGRIYDPLLGRFLSADILVQAPGNLQSYNRYSYVFNNPLSFTDPSGFLTPEEKEKAIEKFKANLQQVADKFKVTISVSPEKDGSIKYTITQKPEKAASNMANAGADSAQTTTQPANDKIDSASVTTQGTGTQGGVPSGPPAAQTSSNSTVQNQQTTREIVVKPLELRTQKRGEGLTSAGTRMFFEVTVADGAIQVLPVAVVDYPDRYSQRQREAAELHEEDNHVGDFKAYIEGRMRQDMQSLAVGTSSKTIERAAATISDKLSLMAGRVTAASQAFWDDGGYHQIYEPIGLIGAVMAEQPKPELVSQHREKFR